MTHPKFRSSFQRFPDSVLAAALALTVFGVYLRTLCPTLYWGDCGEMVAVAATLGIPHPTGYPLYCLLGKLWMTLLPFGSIVWRLNVLSAVFGSLAVACLYGFARVIALPRTLALLAAGLLAFSSTFWQQCLVTETYTLAALFTCLLLFLAARWHRRGCRAGDLRLLAVTYGFALTSHQTNTLFLPGFLGFVLWSAPEMRRLGDRSVRREWVKTLGLGLLPLLTYLYLPLRARTHPVYNWGDVETPFAFYYFVTGRVFSNLMFQQTLPEIGARLWAWAVNLPLELPWALVALAALGLGLFWRRPASRPLALLLTWVLAADIGFVVNYSIYNGYIYFIPTYIVLSICTGRGLLGAWRTLEPRIVEAKRPVFAACAGLGMLALIPMQVAAHRMVDLSGNRTCYNYGRNLLASVPPHGLLIENGDDTAVAAVIYLQTVEGLRPDVVLIRRELLAGIYDPRYQAWANFWYVDSLKRAYPRVRDLYPAPGLSAVQAISEDPLRRILRDAVARRVPVCVLAPQGGPDWFNHLPPFTDDDGQHLRLDAYLNRHYDTFPLGLVTRLYPRGGRPSEAALQAETERTWRTYALDGVFTGQLQRDRFLLLLALNYGSGSLARAALADSSRDYVTAEAAYADVLTLFQSDAAAQGLKRCAAARRMTAQATL